MVPPVTRIPAVTRISAATRIAASRCVSGALLSAVLLGLAPAVAGAATRSITMDNSRVFNPAVITIARGDTVRWSVLASAHTSHDVKSDGPRSYFASPGGESGVHPGQSYSFSFTSAGRFPYFCRAHQSDGMYGTVTVPVTVARVPDSSPVRFKVTVGSLALTLSSPYTRVVQVDGPSAGRHWQTFSKTKKAYAIYAPAAQGTYTFRSWLSAADGSQSKPSPGVSITR
jgi:plastocyanin